MLLLELLRSKLIPDYTYFNWHPNTCHISVGEAVNCTSEINETQNLLQHASGATY
ncbi:hypothetical protein EYZ11_007500 [Aspergillus tanneri]|uniref:Uncharacterized protein n=1 Tax=Aspergillus tanneri TaxID=1220188 RepID=A0A4S3JF54_9EURO|nr:hypothetical protein EYZ11_007500 [Aspergillus tanneri]